MAFPDARRVPKSHGVLTSCAWRQARGGSPTIRVKTLVKWDWVWNPTDRAISTSDMLVPASFS